MEKKQIWFPLYDGESKLCTVYNSGEKSSSMKYLYARRTDLESFEAKGSDVLVLEEVLATECRISDKDMFDRNYCGVDDDYDISVVMFKDAAIVISYIYEINYTGINKDKNIIVLSGHEEVEVYTYTDNNIELIIHGGTR